MKKIQAHRYHDISCGHRVHGHESKCAHLHGHNYRVHFTVEAPELDELGRVIDFSVIKSHLCEWLETNWDHKFLAWEKDPLMAVIVDSFPIFSGPNGGTQVEAFKMLTGSLVWTPFNPTAENMAIFLAEVVGPEVFVGTGVTLTSVTIDETRKCSVTYSLGV
jgi:6-pyruvoyltetrahydropterin/6-carboxytetrahydropterin synthase